MGRTEVFWSSVVVLVAVSVVVLVVVYVVVSSVVVGSYGGSLVFGRGVGVSGVSSIVVVYRMSMSVVVWCRVVWCRVVRRVSGVSSVVVVYRV